MKSVIDTTYEESEKYFRDHPLDVYKKPRSSERFIPWLSAKYYQKGFGEAYMKQSRSKMQMRLSHFAKQNCLVANFSKENTPEFLKVISDMFVEKSTNIKDYLNEIFGLLVEEVTDKIDMLMDSTDRLFLNLISQGYDIGCEKIYKEFVNANIEIGDQIEKQPRAYNMPNKPQLYNLKHDCADVLQYLVSPEDFKSDKNNFKDASNAVEDIKRVEKLYNLLEKNYGQAKSIKFIMSLNSAQRSKSKPCILYKNPKLGFLELVKNILKYRSLNMNKMKFNFYKNPAFTTSTSTKLVVTDKLSIEVKTESDLLQYLPLNDLGIWYTLICYYNRFELDESIEEISRFKINGMTCSEYLDDVTSTYIEGGTLNMDLQKVLCILSLQVNNDTRAINYYLEKNLSFAYKYFKDTSSNVTSVEFTYLGEKFLGIFKEKQGKNKLPHDLKIYFEHSKLQLLPGAYLLLRRLSGLISMSNLLDKHNYATLKDVPFCNSIETNGIQFYGSYLTNTLTLSPNPKMDYPLPFIQMKTITWKSDTMTKLSLTREFNYDFPNLTLMSGSAKLFTLPFLHLKQMNLLTLEDDIYLMDLKLYLSFFMKKSRGRDLLNDSYYTNSDDILKNLVMRGGKLNMSRKAFIRKYGTEEVDHFRILQENGEAVRTGKSEEATTVTEEEKPLHNRAYEIVQDPFASINLDGMETIYNPATDKELDEAERRVAENLTGEFNIDLPLMFTSENVEESTNEPHIPLGNLQPVNELGDFSLSKVLDVEKRVPYTVNILKQNLDNALVKLVMQNFTKSGRLSNILPSSLFSHIVELLNPKYTKQYTPQMKLYINKLIEGYSMLARDFKKLRKFNENTGMVIKNNKVLHVRFLEKKSLSEARIKGLKEQGKYFFEETSGEKVMLCFPVSSEELLLKYCEDVKKCFSFYIPPDIIEVQRKCDKETEKVDNTLSLI